MLQRIIKIIKINKHFLIYIFLQNIKCIRFFHKILLQFKKTLQIINNFKKNIFNKKNINFN